MRIYFFIISVNLLLSFITYYYLRSHFSFARGCYFDLAFLFLIFNMAISRLLPLGTPLPLLKLSAWMSGLCLALLFYITLIALGHGLLHLLDKFLNLQLPHIKIASCALAFVFCFVAWGSYRALHPVIRTESIISQKLTSQASYKIVFLSDIHLGQMLGRSYAEALVTSINQQKPDLVLIAGDLIDEKLRYLEREDTLAPFANIQSKFGVYMVFGNHDYIDNPLQWQKLLEEHNINPLRNRYTIIDNKLKITGLNDWSRDKNTNALEQLAFNNKSYYSILMDHQPRRIVAASAKAYDLYLAGHTHTGQLFPNRLLTQRMYKLDYGRALFGSMTAITNNGYGFWGTPVRTGPAPEMVVIELRGTTN